MATCFERLKDIAKGNYTNDEIRDILADAKKNLAERERIAASSEDELRSAIDSSVSDLDKQTKAQDLRLAEEELQVAQNAALAKPFLELKKNPLKQFVRALTIGTKRGVKGSRARTLASYIVRRSFGERVRLKNIIDTVDGAEEILKSGQYDEQILKSINGKEVENKTAQELGNKIRDLNDDKLDELARHGVLVNKLEDRGIKQIHDPMLLLKTADSFNERRKIQFANIGAIDKADVHKNIAFERWFNIIDSLLDNEKTFGEDVANNNGERRRIQRKIFDKITAEATNTGAPTVQQSYNNSRFYKFKDEASQLGYSNQYGVGGLYDSLMEESAAHGRQLATLQLHGNDPLKTLRKSVQLVAEQNPGRFSQTDVDSAIAEGNVTMRQARGSSSRVYGGSGQLVSAIKFAITAKILPTLLPLVAVNDIAPAINEISRLGGEGAIRSSVKFFGIARKLIANNEELNKFVQSMEYRRDINVGSMEKFSGVEKDELRNKMMRAMMKLSPHEFMNHLEAISAAHELTLQLGQRKDLNFDQLPNFISKTMGLYGIDSDTWDLLRKGSREFGGRQHITTDALRSLDRDVVKDFLKKKKGLERVSETRVDRELANVQQMFTMMVGDRMDIASNAVGAQQRAFWDMRFDRTTPKGRIFSNISSLAGMLRMYETGILQRTLSPIIYGEGAESIGQSIMNNKFDWKGLARWGAITTTLSIIGDTMRQEMNNIGVVAAGEKPRPINPLEITERAVLSTAGVLGPGLEIGKRFGHTAAETMLGPGFVIPGEALDDILSAFRGDNPGKNARDFLTTIVPPFNNSIARNAINHMSESQFGNMHRG